MTGKIIKGIAGFYYVHDGEGQIYECKAKGIFRNRQIKPLVGDNVVFEPLEEEGKGNIVEILERTNSLIRPAVSNIDQVMVFFALTEPEPNLNLLDRFLVTMEVQSVPVILCFNKMDLSDENGMQRYRDIYEPAGYKTLFLSARGGEGVEELRGFLRGKTTVLAGPSGVGKSTITNQIQPQAQMETGSVSAKIKRGKHTTRHSELFYVEKDTYMMDTPGFSSMYIEDMQPEELKYYFPEFEAYEKNCKFQGCVHIGERICGIKQAVHEGEISESRYKNYCLLYQELKEKRRF